MQWATTTFYKEGLPLVADEVNSSGSIAQTMEKEWKPRLSINIYNNPTEQELNEGFHYSPTAHPVSTPAVNTLVVNLALEIQQSYKLGKSSVPDMLLLEFTVLPPLADGDYITSAAAEDMYLCLNQDLGFLLEQLERRLGEGQVQLTLLGLPRYGISPSSLLQMGMPLKQFSTERAAALAGAYLMALYGYEKWVLGGYGNTIFFNRPLIEKLKMPLTQMQQQVADLLVDFEAVQMAYPVREMCEDPVLCRSLAKKWTGDVVFRLQSGWQLAYNEQMPIDMVWEKQPKIPLYIWGGMHHKKQVGDIPAKTSGIDVLNIIRQSWK